MPDSNLEEEKLEAGGVRNKRICGFWRRLLAFLIDIILLALIGFSLGAVFFEQFSHLGSWGPLVGLVIATLYFGIFNSEVMKGQSLGKRLLKIRVVNKEGQLIGWKTSFLRGLLVSALICSNGAAVNNLELFGKIVVGLVAALWIGMIYFYIFNTRTRQSLHDILCGTYVYPIDSIGMPTQVTVARLHYIVYALLLIALEITSLYVQQLPVMKDLQAMNSIYQEIKGLDGVYEAAVNVNHFKEGNLDNKSLKVAVYVKNKPMENDEIWDDTARIVLEKYPEVYGLQRIDVNAIYGYNIGIASGWTSRVVFKAPGEWKEKLHILQLPNEKPLPVAFDQIVIEKMIQDVKIVYNTGDNKALYEMLGDAAKKVVPYANFEKGILKIRGFGEMNNPRYTHYTHFQDKDGSDLFALFYTVDYGVGKGEARIIVMPKEDKTFQIVGIWANVEKKQ